MFVFAVVGDQHVRIANIALSYLKRFSRLDIVVVKGRSTYGIAHDQVVDIDFPSIPDNHQASILAKTNLLSILSGIHARFCYLDSDVIAVSDQVDSIFAHKAGPVTFANDNIGIDMFSRHSVKCRCSESTCSHLRESILCTLGVDIRRCDWTLWNGGVFLFDEESADFLNLWHGFTRQTLTDSFWRTRDQGTLAATVWKLGLQNQPTLPRAFNFIVDRFWGIPLERRAGITPGQFHVWDEYSLANDDGRIRPFFLHFVNGGVQKTGWRNWDEVAALLPPSSGN